MTIGIDAIIKSNTGISFLQAQDAHLMGKCIKSEYYWSKKSELLLTGIMY